MYPMKREGFLEAAARSRQEAYSAKLNQQQSAVYNGHPYNKHGYPEVMSAENRKLVFDQEFGANVFEGEMQMQSQTPQPPIRGNEVMDMQQPSQKRTFSMGMPVTLPEYGLAAAGLLGTAGGYYLGNALTSGGGERWDRTAENTVGNLVGGAAGAYAGGRVLGLPGSIVGGLAGAGLGGYASDRIADAFDPTQGMTDEYIFGQEQAKKEAALNLLNQYLDPRAQARLQQQMMQQ